MSPAPMEPRVPTTERLAAALELRGAPPLMIKHAREGLFDDYKSPLATPCIALVEACHAAGMPDMADRARNGEFDAQPWESAAWAESMKDDPELGPILKAMAATTWPRDADGREVAA